MRMLLIAALVGAFAQPAWAEDDKYITPADQVDGHADLTYVDLLRQVIPDLGDDGASGHLPDGIRHIDGDDAAGEVPETVDIPFLNVEHVEVNGKPTLWLLTDLGGGGTLGTYTLLSVFSDEAKPKLIDAAEVDADRFTNFAGKPLRISKTDEAMLVDSNHSNSEENYSRQELVLVRDGRLVAGMSFLVFGVRACHLWQEETLTVRSKAAASAYWPITASIVRSQLRTPDDAEDCIDDENATGEKTTTFAATYRWDAAAGQYRTKSKALDQLVKDDEALF